MRDHSHFLLCLGLTATLGITGCPSGDDDSRDDVTPPMNVAINSFTSDEPTVASGATVVLSYSVSNATNVSITANGAALLTESTNFMGMVTSAAITEDTTFTLTANGTGGPKTSTVMVTVDENAVEVLTFAANPNPAPAFADVELAWTTAGATQVRLLEGTMELLNTTTDVASGSFTVTLGADTATFRLEAINAAGMDSQDLTVTVEESGRVNFFVATPSVFTGATANITVVWNVEGDEFALTANGNAVPEFTATRTGTITVSVTGTTLFELSATGAGFTDVALAAVAQGSPEVEPNNDTATATPITGGATGAIMPMDDFDFYSFAVATGGNVFAQTSGLAGGCTLDTVIRLYDSTGAELGSNDQSGFEDCSQIDPKIDAYARDLPAGTYYLSVESWQQGLTGDYALVVIAGAGGCGNEILEISLGEQCDDGNTTAGDGCSATCQVQVLGTVTGLDQDQSFDDAIDPPTQNDYFQVVLDGPGFISAQTGSPMVGMCDEGVDTVVTLYDSVFTELGDNDDIDFFGGNYCSFIDPTLDAFASVPAGTYYIGVRSYGQIIADYQLQIRTIAPGCGNSIVETMSSEQCDDGGTAAGDGCSPTCTIETAGTINPPGGMLSVPANGDPALLPTFIEVVINTPGQSITATTTDGAGGCPFPTAFGLFTSDLRRLGVAFGGGGCAFIAPTDPAAGHSWAANLDAGSYLLGVIAENEADMGMVTVEVMIGNAACGNRLTETRASEQCDDGNTANGDGCDNTCQFEGNIMVESEPNNDLGTADTTGAALNMTVTANGAIDPLADQDWWTITVPANASLIVQTYPLFGDPTSCDFEMDTRIWLLDSAGTERAFNDDDDARDGFCSAINGTTVDTGAAMLPAGTYYIRVQQYNDTETIPTYFMDIRLQ